jgi:hypothetical protein
MIKLIVKLLIAFPKLGALFVSVRTAYVMALADKRYEEHLALVEKLKKSD